MLLQSSAAGTPPAHTPRLFQCRKLGCSEGRSAERWVSGLRDQGWPPLLPSAASAVVLLPLLSSSSSSAAAAASHGAPTGQ